MKVWASGNEKSVAILGRKKKKVVCKGCVSKTGNSRKMIEEIRTLTSRQQGQYRKKKK